MDNLPKYKKSLKELNKYYIRRSVPRTFDGPFSPSIKLQILLASSMLRMQVLGDELLSIANQNYFLSAMSTLRMMFEELIALTFVLERLSSSLEIEKKIVILDRAITGRRSGSNVRLKPFNILSMGEGAEKYLELKYPQFKGMYKEIYEFISEYVHPNGPARFHFWSNDPTTIYFKVPPIVPGDINAIFNYGCLTIGMYQLIHKTLKRIPL